MHSISEYMASTNRVIGERRTGMDFKESSCDLRYYSSICQLELNKNIKEH
jgi:hypothetical protein